MLSLVTFTGEIADTKVVLHKEKKKTKINTETQEESCLSCYCNGSRKFTFSLDCYHTNY